MTETLDETVGTPAADMDGSDVRISDTPHYADESVTVHHGDCLDVLSCLPDASIDAVVTDPPYGLGFMGKAWDDLPPGVEWAQECLRVLKPGGHLLAFGGSRTWHRLATAIEDAGFELRDSIAWLYGNGFPKSLDVSKAIDKSGTQNRSRMLEFTAWMRSTGITAQQINDATASCMGSHYLTDQSQPAIATADMFDLLRPHLPEVPERIERLVAERTGIEWTDYVNRPQVRQVKRTGKSAGTYGAFAGDNIETLPATSLSAAWHGWGTALKPAFEPIIVGRKPLAGTVAANVLAHGTGALNIAACRIEHASPADLATSLSKNPGRGDGVTSEVYGANRPQQSVNAAGRWPTNVVLGEHEAGTLGETARYFYSPKAGAKERPVVNGVTHPTVKPLALMRWLVRLVTPPGGIVADTFAGSGTTVEAAILEGFEVLAVEREATYLPLILARIGRQRAIQNAPREAALFDEESA